MREMDERKKKIAELEKLVKDNQVSLDVLLEKLGKALLCKPEIADADKGTFSDPGIFNDIDEYRRLNKEIDDSEASIKEVEAHIAQLRELEQDIEAGEQEEGAQARELSGFYSKLGKLVLEDPALDDFSASYRTQADALVPKVKSLEDRLVELTGQTEGGNVFTWIGKSAQGMVLRSFLTKSLDNLERLYRNAGEQFCRLKSENYRVDTDSADIIDLGNEIEKNKEISASLANGLRKLREERRLIDNEFSSSGGPLKQIQGLKKNISHTQEMLKALYLHFGLVTTGGLNAAGEAQEKPGGRKKRTSPLLHLFSESEQKILDEINGLRELIQNEKTLIEKLQASLDIDEEREKIEKYHRSISEKKLRIKEAEQSIADFESRIHSAEKHIEELQQLL